MVRGLVARHGLADLDALALDRFRLRDEMERLIGRPRTAERKAAFDHWLLPESALAVCDERALNFKLTDDEPAWLYDGPQQFKKHYYGPKPGQLRGAGALDDGAP